MGGAGGPEGQAQTQASAHRPLDKPQLRTDGDSRARPSGRGAHREPRQCLLCPAGGTGLWCLLPRGRWSAGQSAGSAGNPQHRPPPPRESLPMAQCTAPQSVLGFHTILVTPHFRSAAPCGPSPQPAPSFQGGHHLRPHHTPCCCAWPAPGSQDSPGVTACGHCTWPPPAWHGNSYTPTSPVDIFFLHRSGQTQSRSSPASAGRAAPHGGRPRTLGSRGVLLRRPASLPPPGSALWPVSPAVPTWG